MKFISLKNNNDLCEKVKAYCQEKWEKVSGNFARTADLSLTAEKFPQTWVLLDEYGSENGVPKIAGFYQLEETDHLTDRTDLTPFITTLFIDPEYRGGISFGRSALEHARAVLGSMGFDTVYLTTDHIGYYEKCGFREIGLDITDYGCPTKIYSADTITDIRYEVYDKANPKPDHVRLGIFSIQHEIKGNIAELLLWMRQARSVTEPSHTKWFTVTAVSGERIVGAVNFMQNEDDRLNWYIGDLAVAEDFRRRGIARKMLKNGIERIACMSGGGEFIYSYIELDNEPSGRLHTSLGFADTGEVRPFGQLIFGDDETTWVKYL